MDAASITAISVGSVALITSVAGYMTQLRQSKAAVATKIIETAPALAVAQAAARAAVDVAEVTGVRDLIPMLFKRIEALETKVDECEKRHDAAQERIGVLESTIDDMERQRHGERSADAIMWAQRDQRERELADELEELRRHSTIPSANAARGGR